MIRVFRWDEISTAENGAGMGKRVNFDCHPFLEPPLEMRFGWRDGIAENTQWGTAVDFFESLEDRATKTLESGMVPHVVNAQRDNGLHAVLAYPLWGGEFGGIQAYIERIFAVQIGQAIGLRTGST